MSGVEVDTRGVILPCLECGQRNRIPFIRLGSTVRCGRCKNLLQVNVPVEVRTEEEFDAFIRDSAVPVLVDFWAPWCGPCKMVAPEFEKAARSADGRYVVAKVNTEELGELGRRYSIFSIPTFIVFYGGREVQRSSGAQPAEALKRFVLEAVRA